MEKLPSTLVVHKKADSADTRLATMRGPFLRSPLEQWLGVLQQGTYQQAQGDPQWAFEPVASLWPGEEVAEEDLEVEEEEERQEDLSQEGAVTDEQALRQLYNQIQESRDCLCFIRYQEPGALMPQWYLVNVDLEETDPVVAKKKGMYWCQW